MIELSIELRDPALESNHRRTSAALAAAALVAAVLTIFYVLPTLLEWKFTSALAPFGLILIGDALGCAVLAVFNWRRGIALYVALTAIEYLGLNFGILSTFELTLVTDAIPAAFLSAGAVRFLACLPNLN